MEPSARAAASDGDGVAFPTRVDRWLVLVLVFGLGISIAAVALSAREAPEDAIIGAVIGAASIALVLALSVPTRYTIDQSELVIRSGLLRYRIRLRSIQRVYPTRNPLSAPAWSLDRLGVEYERTRGRGFALISPQRADEFLDLLADRAGLTPRGRELRRP